MRALGTVDTLWGIVLLYLPLRHLPGGADLPHRVAGPTARRAGEAVRSGRNAKRTSAFGDSAGRHRLASDVAYRRTPTGSIATTNETIESDCGRRRNATVAPGPTQSRRSPALSQGTYRRRHR